MITVLASGVNVLPKAMILTISISVVLVLLLGGLVFYI